MKKQNENEEHNFELPKVEDDKKVIQVHRGPGTSVCESCEG